MGIEMREDYCELAARRLAARFNTDDDTWLRANARSSKGT